MTRTPATAFRSILCPVDFSTHSRDALRYAVATAQRFGARVTVMFVNDPLLIAAASRSLAGRHDFIHRTRLELERFVNRVAAGPSSQDDIALVVTTGNPADEILRTARRLRSDLIVMGTEGLNGFQKLFFGSTTEQVLHRVTIPVLAIPPSKGSRPPRKPLMSIGRVIAPLDLAGEWQSDAVRAATVAAAFDAELVLVHVLARIQTPPWLKPTSAAVNRRRVARARAVLERVTTKLPKGSGVVSRVLEGNPADAISELARGSGSLVVMSLRGGAGVWGARRGSIAYQVLSRSSTPVLALPRQRLGGPFLTRLSKAVTAALTERDRIEMAGIDALLSMGSCSQTRTSLTPRSSFPVHAPSGLLELTQPEHRTRDRVQRSQSDIVNRSVENARCRNGAYTTDTCSITDSAMAANSQRFRTGRETRVSSSDRALNRLNS